MASKIFVVTREDLSEGQQAVQLGHGLTEFIFQHPEMAGRWHRESNTLAYLIVPDEAALGVLLKRARRRDLPHATFHEPDRNNEMTAIALGPAARSLVSGLPLAFAEPRGLSSEAVAADSKTASRRFDPDSPHQAPVAERSGADF